VEVAVDDHASLIPVAEYLRMSSEHQQYSMENQEARLRDYAAKNRLNIIKRYMDPGKSGVVLKHRHGLIELLNDVVEGKGDYKAILVYDISRWGRFQDVDESAYYEFLCKKAGIKVHYCAEPFRNDGGMPDIVMKALKRIMAGEYSRELSERTF
jgi:DNA invertase Pin-like site-specific DNA recombinase